METTPSNPKESENKGNIFDVVPVSKEDYEKIKRSFKGIESIRWESYSFRSMSEPVENAGATSCIMAYFGQQGSEKFITGHFAWPTELSPWALGVEKNVYEKTSKTLYPHNEEGLLQPNKYDLERSTYMSEGSQELFRKMVEDARNFFDVKKMKVYLFGQGHLYMYLKGQEAPQLASEQIRKERVKTQLERLGVRPENIFDHRSNDIRSKDSTLFVPNNTIYHCHEVDAIQKIVR